MFLTTWGVFPAMMIVIGLIGSLISAVTVGISLRSPRR
jgi:ATP/ADP translocase